MYKMIIGTTKDCPSKGFKSCQINNLKIKWSKMSGKFTVSTPTGQVWEEFKNLSDAKKWAKETKDFVR